MSASMQGYYILVGDETRGPFTFVELRRMRKQREIDGETLVAKPGDDTWHKFSELNLSSGTHQRLRRVLFAVLCCAVLIAGPYLVENLVVWRYGDGAGQPSKHAKVAARQAILKKFPGNPRIHSIQWSYTEKDRTESFSEALALDYEADVEYINEFGGPVRKRIPIHVSLFGFGERAQWSGSVITDKDYCIQCNPKRHLADIKARLDAERQKFEAELETIRRGGAR